MDIDWIALDMDCIGAKLASFVDCSGLEDSGSRWVRIAFCELRRVPHVHGFDRLGCLGWVDITWIALEVDCIGLKALYFCWIALDCVRECKAGRWRSFGLQLSWIGLDWKLGVVLLVRFVHERNFESLKCQPRPGDSFFWKCSKVRPLRCPCVTQNFGLDWIGNSAWHCWWDSFTSGIWHLSNANHGRETVFFGSVQKLGL